VETEEQAAWLARFGCEELQGDLLGKAMPADALASLLRENTGGGRKGAAGVS